ncbi:MAG: low molecular weight phosphatase family protein [Cognatishimia sp.]
MVAEFPQSVLFCCDHNAVRSPMAEGVMKKLFGTDSYVQSAGLQNDLEIDGFAISVCKEIDVELSRHRSRSFEEMEQWGDQLSSFDLIVALTPASHAKALELTKFFHTDVQFWPILDPTGHGESREAKLGAYRLARDEIIAHLKHNWGDARQ